MPRITFHLHGSADKIIDASSGQSLMEAARSNDIPGIIAECGGTLSCATCHVYVDQDWVDRIPAPDANEVDLLEAVPEPRPGSRLSCQIMLSDAMDGLSVEVPESQI